MDEKLRRLKELGAAEFEHLDGALINHLKGTKQLLKDWSAPLVLQDAGLYHAVYGTAAFNESLVSTAQRNEIAKIIGADAEELVYQYCACDREHFFSKIGIDKNPEFRNRFTGDSYLLPTELLRHFCELTAANEVEIAMDNPSFVNEHGTGLNKLFSNMAPYLSQEAQAKVESVLR